MPNKEENIQIESIFIIVLINVKSINFLFFNINIFNVDDVIDIKQYPTINE